MKSMNLGLVGGDIGHFSAVRFLASRRIPTARSRRAASPAEISRTECARRQERARQAPTLSATFRTSPSRERKTASIAKRMKKVWIDAARRINIPSPDASSRLPSSPFIRGNMRPATTHLSQIVEPSAVLSATTPRAVRIARSSGTGRSKGLDLTERPDHEKHRRAEQDHEHGREDEENEWEQDLDRCLLGTFLGNRVPPPAHLVGEVAHDLPDRHTEPFALDDRADERSHRRRVATTQHVQHRFLDRKTHGLFLECQPELLAEGAGDAAVCGLQRADEPQ